MFTTILPQLHRVHDVLPEHVTTGSYRSYGVQIGVGHPDREGGVLLEETLSGIKFVAEVTADAAANQEEREAEYEVSLCTILRTVTPEVTLSCTAHR